MIRWGSLGPRLSRTVAQRCQFRGLALPSSLREYDLFGDEEDSIERANIGGYSLDGFEVNDIWFRGHVLVLPSIALLWKPVKDKQETDLVGPDEIEVDSLELLRMIWPKPDILVLGTGARFAMAPPHIKEFCDSLDIAVEAMSSNMAIGTFNILNQEGRKVAGALLKVDSFPRR